MVSPLSLVLRSNLYNSFSVRAVSFPYSVGDYCRCHRNIRRYSSSDPKFAFHKEAISINQTNLPARIDFISVPASCMPAVNFSINSKSK